MESLHLETDVLVVGAGGAGMYAAIAAAREGAQVTLLDRSLIGRGGATVMAQMTVAVALGEQCPDSPEDHYADTLRAGRGLCDPALSWLLCSEGPACVREMDEWKVGWARENGHIRQVMAPGHDRPRCTYVDFLDTGPSVSRTLRTRVIRTPGIRRVGDLCVTDLVVRNGECVGAVASHLDTGEVVTLGAKAVVIATGGLTRLYRRNSASANMGGDGYALALRAGAELVDMEFVQFFPIGHLAPRLIGMDPIMWDPFRYKLGGRLVNGRGEEFTERYGVKEGGAYVVTRDLATYAITKEVEAGRGSPHGGAYLSFEHLTDATLRGAFGPVIDRLAKNGIDLTRMPIEVAPIAHYHMGGVRANADMETRVPGLLVAGEAVGGANGANRLSGNAVTEAFVFGRKAGIIAARRARVMQASPWQAAAAAPAIDLLSGGRRETLPFNSAEAVNGLQALMADYVGPFRTDAQLGHALGEIVRLQAAIGDHPPVATAFDFQRQDWLDLRNMALVAETVARAATARTESRGAHQREDHPGIADEWLVNQVIRLDGGRLAFETRPADPASAAFGTIAAARGSAPTAASRPTTAGATA
jgi:succinate dehydrogenase/fumarate reductase flavoprotein subunit